MKDRSILLGSLSTALLASVCCLGPLILGGIGLGSLGFAASLAYARPWFLGITAILLAVGFYLAYRPSTSGDCAPGDACAAPSSRQPQRIALWVVTLLAVALATYPSWGARSSGRQTESAPAGAATVVVDLDVQGMTCDACETEIERRLLDVAGVVRASVDYEKSRAAIVVAADQADPRPLVGAVEKAGYRATVAAPRTSPGVADSHSRLAGQWRGPLTVGEGRTSELVVDLREVAGRWTGEFDLLDFGVENYPVEVTLEGHRVMLHLTAAQIDFSGTLSDGGDVLAGIASTRGHEDSLVLRRVAEAQVSQEFLQFEASAVDTARAQPLSARATELRQKFNDDRAHTRLVMLLSPT